LESRHETRGGKKEKPTVRGHNVGIDLEERTVNRLEVDSKKPKIGVWWGKKWMKKREKASSRWYPVLDWERLNCRTNADLH